MPRTGAAAGQGRTVKWMSPEPVRRRVPRSRGWLVRRMLLASDLVGLALAFATAETLYQHRTQADSVAAAGEVLLFLASLPVWVVVAKLYGLYDRDEERVDHSTADEMLGVFHLVTVGTWLLYAAAAVTGVAHPVLAKLLVFWTLAVVAIPLLRSAARSLCRQTRSYTQNAVVVGTDEIAVRIACKLGKHPEYGIRLLGFVEGAAHRCDDVVDGLGVLGDLDDLPALAERLDVERVIIAFPSHEREEIVDAARALNELGVQVDIVPRYFDVLSPSVDMHSVEGLPLVGVRAPHLSRSSAFVKRAFDLGAATAGLVLLAPLLALAALAIKLDSDGPVLFRQLRMGAGDRPFPILKLRTMVAEAEALKPTLLHLNKHALAGGDARMFKIDADPRTTRVGAFLRRYSIDEIPQLWNVLRGEMSIVGPRPLILDEDRFVRQWRRRRLTLRPGITGLWQVLGSDKISFGDMVQLDYVYVTSWSLAGDLRLLLRTLPVVLRKARSGRAAFAPPVAEPAPRPLA